MNLTAHGLRVHAEMQFMRQRVALFFGIFDGQQRRMSHACEVQMTIRPIEPASMLIGDNDPLLLDRDQAQQLLDELWRLGFRPQDGAGSLAHVEAQKAHLQDLRRLVFKDGGKD